MSTAKTPRRRPYRVVEGTGFIFWEQGMEGMVWAVQNQKYKSYDGLEILGTGDILTIFADNKREVALWSGELRFSKTRGLKAHPLLPFKTQRLSNGAWMNGIPTTIDGDWLYQQLAKEPPVLLLTRKPDRQKTAANKPQNQKPAP